MWFQHKNKISVHRKRLTEMICLNFKFRIEGIMTLVSRVGNITQPTENK